jgi:hypothetical protein
MGVGIILQRACRVERLESRVLASASHFEVTLGQGGARALTFRQLTVSSSGRYITLFSYEGVTVSLGGPGSALVGIDATGAVEKVRNGVVTFKGTIAGAQVGLRSIDCTATTSKSVLRITTPGRDSILCGPITINGSIKSILGPLVQLGQRDGTEVLERGDITADGTVGQITLAQIQQGTITIRGSVQPLSLYVPTIDGVSVSSAAPIKLLDTIEWTDLLNPADVGTLSGPSIGKIILPVDPGNYYGFNVNINTGSIGSLVARNSPVAGDWTVGKVGTLSVGTASMRTAMGAVPWTLHAQGIGSVSFSQKDNGFPAQGFVIAADRIGSLDLGPVSVKSEGSPFGVVAHQVHDLRAELGGKKLRIKNLTSATQVAAAFSEQQIDPGRFYIQIA